MLYYDFINTEEITNNFENSVQEVQSLRRKPSDGELLHLYGLYKQSLLGNNKTPEPSVLNLKEKSKWNAWKINIGKSKTKAMQEYSDYVYSLKMKYGVNK